jgi:uncharacterized membrane protein YhaH (DUF805 family)
LKQWSKPMKEYFENPIKSINKFFIFYTYTSMRKSQIKQYVDSLFEWRVWRGTFFWRMIFTMWWAVFFLYFIVSIFCWNVGYVLDYFDGNVWSLIFAIVLCMGLFFFVCIAISRRLHDIGLSWAWLVLYLVLWIILLVMAQLWYFNIFTAIILIIIALFNLSLLISPSDEWKNKYWENPKNINEKKIQEEYEKTRPQREAREKRRQERDEKLPKWRKKIRDFEGLTW